MNESGYSFWSYVRSDLVRAATLCSLDAAVPSGLKLWRGIFSPRFAPVLLCRLAYALAQYRLGPLAKLVSLLNFMVFGIEISLQCNIGRGLFLPHTQGTVIGARAIGPNAIIFQGVTLGAKELDIGSDANTRPTLGANVIIGAGAKVLGGIQIGDYAKVGANAVVIEDVPVSVVVGGIPAKIIK